MKITYEEYKMISLDKVPTGEVFFFRDEYYIKMNKNILIDEMDNFRDSGIMFDMDGYIPAVDIKTGEFITLSDDVQVEFVDDYNFSVKKY